MTTTAPLDELARHFNVIGQHIHDAPDFDGYAAPVLALLGDHFDLIITIHQPEGVSADSIVPLLVQSLAWPVGAHTIIIGSEAWITPERNTIEPPLAPLAETDPSIRSAIITTALNVRTADTYTEVAISSVTENGEPTWLPAEAHSALTDEAEDLFRQWALDEWTTESGEPLRIGRTERAALVDSMLVNLSDVIGACTREPSGEIVERLCGL